MIYKTLIIIGLCVSLLILTDCKTKNEPGKVKVPAVQVQPDSINQEQVISIHEAAVNGQTGQVASLLAGGVDINLPDADGRTALIYAAFNGYTETIKMLLEKGALVNLCDTNGRTALMMASSGPYPSAVKMLLDHNADPNITDKEEHFTALMYAAAEGQLDVVRILLSYRADPSFKDIDGDDAMTFAANNGNNEIAVLLQSFKNK
jgi:ankyrin repeat protein